MDVTFELRLEWYKATNHSKDQETESFQQKELSAKALW